jgi:hypothetical protein
MAGSDRAGDQQIDLPGAGSTRRRQIEEIIGLDASHAVLASAKSGIGVVTPSRRRRAHAAARATMTRRLLGADLHPWFDATAASRADSGHRFGAIRQA